MLFSRSVQHAYSSGSYSEVSYSTLCCLEELGLPNSQAAVI